MEQLYTTEEVLTFTIDTAQSAVSANDLIRYLSGLDELATSINHTLNAKCCAGYDKLEISILAIEKGSFKLPVVIKKISENPLASTIIGGLIVGAFFNTPFPKNSECPISKEELLENKNTIKAVTKIAETAVESDNVLSLSVDYQKDDGSLERVTIGKEQLKSSIQEIIEEPEQESVLSRGARLIIIAPVLESKPAKWKVRFEDNEFSAQMTDENFLELMDKEHIAFGKGDVLIADVETKITRRENGIPSPKHYIRKVRQYPHYSSSARMQQTSIDFEDEQ